MRLPLIKHISQFIEKNDEDFIEETIEVLEHLTEFDGLKDEELDTLGELTSNMYCNDKIFSSLLTCFSAEKLKIWWSTTIMR